jgi:hypothetical protein
LYVCTSPTSHSSPYLDKERNIFFWQPGMGFLVENRLIFLERTITGAKKKRVIMVRIIPKY